MFARALAKSASSSRTTKPVQAKLEIGRVNHPLEHEADRIADSVLRQADRPRERQPRSRSDIGSASSFESSSAGRPLEASVREYFEPRFGFDFSKVRIHADDTAAESARSIGALAYTAGSQISFDSGRFQPNSGEGRRLVAHELTHVVQQGQVAPLQGTTSVQASRVAPLIQRDTPNARPVAPIGQSSRDGHASGRH